MAPQPGKPEARLLRGAAAGSSGKKALLAARVAVSLIFVDSQLIRYFAAKKAFSAAKRPFGTEFAAKTAILAAKPAYRPATEAVAGGNDEAGMTKRGRD